MRKSGDLLIAFQKKIKIKKKKRQEKKKMQERSVLLSLKHDLPYWASLLISTHK